MSGVVLGLDCKAYRNTGTHASPTWNLVDDVKDVTLNLEKGEADVTTRANSGWRARKGTLKDGTVEFTLLHNPDRADSVTDFEAIRDAWINNTAVEWAFMDGAIATAGSQGLRATMEVVNFSRGEQLENASEYNVKLVPTLAAQAPDWFEAV